MPTSPTRDTAEQSVDRTPPGTRPIGCQLQVLRRKVGRHLPNIGGGRRGLPDHAPGLASTARTPRRSPRLRWQRGTACLARSGGQSRTRTMRNRQLNRSDEQTITFERCGFSADITPPSALAAARRPAGDGIHRQCGHLAQTAPAHGSQEEFGGRPPIRAAGRRWSRKRMSVSSTASRP